jgi:mannose-6-phosphate isomerase-like protein (cupin superfamily)
MAKAKAKTRPGRGGRTKVRSTRRGAAAKKRTQSRPRHKFTVSQRREEDFKAGLRSYATYRDLGMSDATAGMVQAHVIRMIPPCDPKEVSKLHFHDVDFQMVYVLKGWMKSEFEGQGAILMQEGSAWIQPPRIKHKVLDYSDDCELLEIILPAKFETVTLE